MTLVLEAIAYVAGLVASLLGVAQAIQSLIGTSSGGTTIFQRLNGIADSILALDTAITSVLTKEDIIIANETSLMTAITAIPTGPQLAANPVHLPVVPPAGYGIDYGIAASSVWGFVPGPGAATTGDLVNGAGYAAFAQGISLPAVMLRNSKYFTISGTWSSNSQPDSAGSDPIFPVANILLTDTLLTFLVRESFYPGWALESDGTAWVQQDPAANDFIYRTTITADEFLILRNGLFGSSGLDIAPVWPGLAKVTLGVAVALTNGMTVAGPLDGVIIHLTAVGYPAGFYPFGALKSYRGIGAIVFVDDNGQGEYAQSLGLDDSVISPRQMTTAAHALIRLQSGVVGTIQPWTRL